MEHQSHDQVFFKNFALVMGALFVIFFICITAASFVSPAPEPDDQAVALLEARLQPAGEVVTDPAALVKVAAVSTRAPLSGEEVLAKVCNACHLSGVLGAPKEGDTAAWSARLQAAGGLDGLASSAINGKNSMPPRGGDPDLTDEEIHAAVELLANSEK